MLSAWLQHRRVRQFLEWLEASLLNPITGGLTAIVTVMAGASVEFFKSDIEQHRVPWPFIEWHTISWSATLFWLSVYAVGFLLGGSQWAQARQARRSRQALDSAIQRIESLPPEDFLADYQDLLRRAAISLIVGALERRSREVVEHAIRNVLATIIVLARKYDGIRGGVYAANIMLYREQSIAEAKNPIGFVDKLVGHPDYRGLLELVRVLSTSEHQAPDYGPDTEVPELVIPVPRAIEPVRGKDLTELHPVLPGASWAFVHREFAGERCSTDRRT